MKLGTDEDTGTGMDVQDGMGYKDYMRMLLFLEGKERMSMRAMGIIEKNMQSIYGQPAFRIDYCAGRMEIRTVCNLRRGIKYQRTRCNSMRRIKMPFQVSKISQNYNKKTKKGAGFAL